jgi:hypothetical protein
MAELLCASDAGRGGIAAFDFPAASDRGEFGTFSSRPDSCIRSPTRDVFPLAANASLTRRRIIHGHDQAHASQRQCRARRAARSGADFQPRGYRQRADWSWIRWSDSEAEQTRSRSIYTATARGARADAPRDRAGRRAQERRGRADADPEGACRRSCAGGSASDHRDHSCSERNSYHHSWCRRRAAACAGAACAGSVRASRSRRSRQSTDANTIRRAFGASPDWRAVSDADADADGDA